MSDQEPSESARRAFGTQLKELRRDAHLSGVELAQRCGWHKTKVSKIEHGTQSPTEEDIRRWAAACAVEGQTPELIAMSREIEQMWTDYKRWHRPGMKRLQFQAMDLYAKTKLLRVYESLFIPGFLQTVEYAKAQFTIHAKLHGLPLDDVEEAAQNRMVRKRFLGTGAPIFSFLMEASALTNNTGGAEVMNGQLDHLLEVSRLPYVSIGIIPQGRPRSLYPGEGFYLFDESLLKQEFWSGAFQTSRPENISYFARVFAALRDQAVFGTAARDEIEAARGRLQGI
ncbi:helix-turn-helix transcriptional regulator [Streptomyces sp. FH025]|uniref:helix-turn-helix domain-containing protein n=1 Tax=Streptomyces sp. FH025 TaxID=2815937 RepID=UPI001A9F41FB|nr:helix-turn-helix transcriptional regulator [Streptomyces sp. FH025]MBO1415237.1 helix-turn-helix transcriptional regulator [Streptomyces sp. FH025]